MEDEIKILKEKIRKMEREKKRNRRIARMMLWDIGLAMSDHLLLQRFLYSRKFERFVRFINRLADLSPEESKILLERAKAIKGKLSELKTLKEKREFMDSVVETGVKMVIGAGLELPEKQF